MSRFVRFATLCASVLAAVSAAAQQQVLPFAADTPPTFFFEESYSDSAEYSIEDEEFLETSTYSLSFSARASLTGIDRTAFDNNSLVLTTVIGNLDLELPFAEGQRSVVAGQKVIRWVLEGVDPDTYDDLAQAGTVELRYDQSKLTVTLSLSKDWEDYSIIASDMVDVAGPLNFTLPLTFTVGNYGFTGRLSYVTGTTELFNLTLQHGSDQETFTDLAKVRLSGTIDSTPPVVRILDPVDGQAFTANTITVSGLASDDHSMQSVSLRVNGGAPQPLTINPNATWSLPGVILNPGVNVLLATAVDAAGNVGQSSLLVRYVQLGDLTVAATGDGSGIVTSDFFQAIQYIPSQPSPVSSTRQEVGTYFTVVAEPGPDAVFDHWTSNVALTPQQAASSILSISMQAQTTLTAHFLRNPFAPVRGRYTGLVESSDPADRGFLTGSLSAKGGFSLIAKIGRLTIPVKGQFSPSGEFQSVVTVRKVPYTVECILNVSGVGQRQITGSIRGGGIDATIAADLSTFSKKLNPVAAELVGAYNVLLPPAEGNGDANYPAGIGFGRLTVTRSGMATLVGRLGDGTPITTTSTLAGEATQSERYLPFFAALYRRTGSISGRLTFDLNNPASDVTGTLNWYKPAGGSKGTVQPEGFTGQTALAGGKFGKHQQWQAAFQSTSGTGQLLVSAPASGKLPPLQTSAAYIVGADGTITVTPGAESALGASLLAVDPKTGLLSGSISEGGVARAVSGIVVTRKLNRVGGFFVRGKRTGSIEVVSQ